MKQFAIIITVFLLSVTGVQAQVKQNIADQHFDRMEYAKCVDMFDELAEKCFKEKKNADWKNVRRAAVANFHLFQMNEAVNYFSKLKTKNLLTESDRELYIQALRFDGKYGKSNEVIRESHNLFPNNEFFTELYEKKDEFDQLFVDSAFYMVSPIAINSGVGDFATSYYDNGITFISKSKNVGFVNGKYGWDNDYFLNIMHAKFNEDSTLQKPELLKHAFVSRAHDGPVSFSPDGNEMVITKNELGKKNGKDIVRLSLYFSKKQSGEWGELIPFEFNNDAYDNGHAVYTEDGNELYFVSNKPGGIGEADIYRCKRLGNGWTEPQNLGNTINSAKNDLFPFVQNGTLYFASAGHYGLGGLDIFEVTLNSGETPHNIGYPINTSHDDFGLIFDSSKRIGYLSSNRGDNIDRIYDIEKKKIKIDLNISVVAQFEEKEPISDQVVYIMNTTTQQLDSLYTNDQGICSLELTANKDYQVYTRKDEFILLNEQKVSTRGIKQNKTLDCELVLKPTTIIVHLRVIEKETKNVIPLATTSITDYNLGWDTTLITDNKGMVSLTVDRNKVYWAHGAKKGYIDADVSFNSSSTNGKVIDLELELPKIKKGEKFKLENIFYDLNKSTLRPESKSSLDKLADFIIKNNLKIELSAHTDSRGSHSYNQRLSQARAQSCVDYLISKGVSKYKIRAKGYGETQLVNGCKNGVQCSEEEHQENRRTEVKILEVK